MASPGITDVEERLDARGKDLSRLARFDNAGPVELFLKRGYGLLHVT